MLNVFGAPPPKKQVLETEDFLKMLNVWGKPSQKKETFNTFNISPVLFKPFWQKTFNISPVLWTWVHETGERFNVFSKSDRNREMLNMLNVLNVLGEI